MKQRVIRICLCVLVILCCAGFAQAEEPLTYVQFSLSKRNIQYDEVMSKYKELWIGYTTSNKTVTIPITTSLNEEILILNKVYYFYKRDNKYILMGYVDKTGLYDKNNNILKDVSNVSPIILGMSSTMIETPLIPNFILQSESNPKEFYETDAFATLDFDIENNSIRLRDLSIFFE